MYWFWSPSVLSLFREEGQTYGNDADNGLSVIDGITRPRERNRKSLSEELARFLLGHIGEDTHALHPRVSTGPLGCIEWLTVGK